MKSRLQKEVKALRESNDRFIAVFERNIAARREVRQIITDLLNGEGREAAMEYLKRTEPVTIEDVDKLMSEILNPNTNTMKYFKVRFLHQQGTRHEGGLTYLAFEEEPTEEQARKKLEGISWIGSPVAVLSIDEVPQETALNHKNPTK